MNDDQLLYLDKTTNPHLVIAEALHGGRVIEYRNDDGEWTADDGDIIYAIQYGDQWYRWRVEREPEQDRPRFCPMCGTEREESAVTLVVDGDIWHCHKSGCDFIGLGRHWGKLRRVEE